jgi:molybdate transport system regulatory protein
MDSDTAPVAALQIRRGDGSRAGPERIRLLAAIETHGSISSAARASGLTYRAAWDAVQALNNLFDRPLVESQSGGTGGGGATLTPAGRAVVASFGKLEADLNRLVGDLNQDIAAHSDIPGQHLIWSLGMRTSARNALHGVVEGVIEGPVNCEVALRVSPSVLITAVVTRGSVEALDLAPGRSAIALIKASFIILVPGDAPVRTSARNALSGVVVSHEAGAVSDEVVLEIDAGKTLAATITRGSGEALGFKVGDKAQALIKASHVILAVD